MPLSRYFRFRLRTLLMAVAIVAVGPLGWVAYCKSWIRQRHEMLPKHSAPRVPTPNPPYAPIEPPGLLWVFGELGTYKLTWSPASTESLDDLQRAFPESKIEVYANDHDLFPVRTVEPH